MSEIIEIWRPVVGYESLYSVSNLGRVRSEERLVVRQGGNNYLQKARIMKPGAGVKSGYLTLRLSNKGETKTQYVHHLVLAAFAGPKALGQEACHCDGNRTNNVKNNLRWGTRKENHADKNLHGTSPVGERHPMAKLSEKEVLALRSRRNEGLSFTELSNEFGVTRMTAHRAATGTSWSHIA